MGRRYCFDYIEDDVMKWAPDVRRAITKEMISFLPFNVTLPYFMPDRFIPATDYYGGVIDDYDEWKKQREKYIDNLFNKLKGR